MSTGLPEKTCEILREALPVHYRQGPGGRYPYHRGEDVIRQLNKAFKHTWSSEVLNSEEKHDQVLVLVSISVFLEGDVITHNGYGSSQIAKKRGTGEVIDIGNAYKAAYTNAVKKAAEQFGIGLGTSEEIEAVVPKSPTKRPQPPSKPRISAPSRPTVSRPEPLPARSTNNNNISTPKATTMSPSGQGPSSQTVVIPGGDETINEIQKEVLIRLAAVRNRTQEELIKGALKNTNKTTFEELLKKEAVIVIRYTNNVAAKPQ